MANNQLHPIQNELKVILGQFDPNNYDKGQLSQALQPLLTKYSNDFDHTADEITGGINQQLRLLDKFNDKKSLKKIYKNLMDYTDYDMSGFKKA